MVPHSLSSSSSWQRSPKIASDKSPGLRKLQSTLNKVSDKNYDKILIIVRECLQTAEVTPQELVDAILDQCVRQACYVQLFARMVLDMNSAVDCCDTMRGTISKFCDAFCDFDASLVDVTLIETKVHKDDNYMAFCDQMKVKSKLIGRCKLVLHLVEMGLYSRYSIADIMTMIIEHARRVAARHDDNGHLDMLLDFATEYKNFARRVPWHASWVSELSRHILPHVHNSRQRFKIMDIIDAASSITCEAQICRSA